MDWLSSSMIITVFYSSNDAPELRLDLWHDGYAPGVAGFFTVSPFMINDSFTGAQFGFRDIRAAFGDDFAILDALMISATYSEITINKVLVGWAE